MLEPTKDLIAILQRFISNESMKIGVFDSGVGGLTVLKELGQHFPSTSFLYLGDTARLPYGIKSPETIRQYSEQIMNFLIQEDVGAIVIACNTASSQVPEAQWRGIPVFNVIEPGARAAVQTSRTRKIGVLGTRATIASEIYTKKIQVLADNAEVYSQSCPLLVPLAEEGWTKDPVTDLVIQRYLEPLLQKNIDTLILGCTHYPILKDAIQKICGNKVQLVDSGKAICESIRETLLDITGTHSAPGRIEFLATDLPEHTQKLAEKILHPLKVDRFELIHLKS